MKTFIKVLRWILTASTVSVLFILIAACNSKQPNETVKQTLSNKRTGSPAFNFTLKSTSGETVSLSDFKGNVVIIDFWATWCPPCRMSTPALVKLNKKYRGKGVTILGVSLDEDKDEVAPYMEHANVEHIVLYSDSSIDKNYKIRSIPTFLVIDQEGNIKKRYNGFYPGMEREWESDIKELLKIRS